MYEPKWGHKGTQSITQMRGKCRDGEWNRRRRGQSNKAVVKRYRLAVKGDGDGGRGLRAGRQVD